MTIAPEMNLVKQAARVTVTVSPSDAEFTRTGTGGAKLVGSPPVNAKEFGIKSDNPLHPTVTGIITVTVPPGGPPEAPFPVSADAWFVKFENLLANVDSGNLDKDLRASVEVSLKYKPEGAPIGPVTCVVTFSVQKRYKGGFTYDNNGARLEGGTGSLEQTYTASWQRATPTSSLPKKYRASVAVKCSSPAWSATAKDK
jgi:hypothetical protein